MRKILISILILLLLAAPCLGADYTLSRLETECAVQRSGRCRITQKAELIFSAPVSSLTVPVGRGAEKAEIAGADAKTFTEDGCTYAELTLDAAQGGTLLLEVSYTTSGLAEKTADGQRFTAALTDGLWDVPAERYSFTVEFPDAPGSLPSFTAGREIASLLTVSAKGRFLSAVLRGGLQSGEALTMTVDVAKGYFSLPGEPNASAFVRWLLPVLVLLCIVLALLYWFRFLRSGSFRIRARTQPPDGMTAAEIPFLLCGGHVSLGLLVCEWASLGLLTVTEKPSGRVLLHRTAQMPVCRRTEEQKLFEFLFRTDDVCEADSNRFRRASELCDRSLRRFRSRRLYDRRSGSPAVLRLIASAACGIALLYSMDLLLAPMPYKGLLLAVAFLAGFACGYAICFGFLRWLMHDPLRVVLGAAALLFLLVMGRIGGGMLCTLPALLLALAVSAASLGGGRLTEHGLTVLEQTLGFRRFLHHVDGQHLAQMVRHDPQLFYRTMLYAHAFGIGRSYGERLPGRTPEPCTWLRSAGRQAARGEEYAALLSRVVKKMDQA